MKKRTKPRSGLCWRCEWRARFFESGAQPRFECGQIDNAVIACYMYRPVAPVKLVKNDPEDPRPVFGPAMIASRVRIHGIAEGNYTLYVDDEGNMIPYWIPPEEETDEKPHEGDSL